MARGKLASDMYRVVGQGAGRGADDVAHKPPSVVEAQGRDDEDGGGGPEGDLRSVLARQKRLWFP